MSQSFHETREKQTPKTKQIKYIYWYIQMQYVSNFTKCSLVESPVIAKCLQF